MNCKNTNCNKCSTKSRYCGDSLECLEVTKGESYDSIFKKINDRLCNEVEGTTYTFEDKEDCENGGIVVTENTNGESTVVYEVCFSCCGTSEGLYLSSILDNPFDFNGENDIGDSPFILPFNTNSSISSMELVIPEAGDYSLNFDFIVYSTYDLGVNYRIIINDSPSSILTKGVLIDGATPPKSTNTNVINAVLSGLNASDTVNIEFRSVSVSGGSPDPGDIYITSATLILNKI